MKEYVQVVNVEMMLRVMKDGKTVGGFRKGDFILTEDGVERPINGFFELKKRMKPDPVQRAEPAAVPGPMISKLSCQVGNCGWIRRKARY